MESKDAVEKLLALFDKKQAKSPNEVYLTLDGLLKDCFTLDDIAKELRETADMFVRMRRVGVLLARIDDGAALVILPVDGEVEANDFLEALAHDNDANATKH